LTAVPKFRDVFKSRSVLLLSVFGLAIVALAPLLSTAPALAGRAQSQSQTPPAIKFEYEVASIKPDKSGGGHISMTGADDGFTATNFPLQRLVLMAFGVQDDRLFGLPNWVASENFDIEAKMESSVADAYNKLSTHDRPLVRQQMIQALLVDRFRLAFHREGRDLPIYSLVVAKNGSKLQESKIDDANTGGRSGLGPGMGVSQTGRSGPVTITAQQIPIANLAAELSRQLGRMVLDKTGLTGKYDFVLKWTPDEIPAPSGNMLNGQPAPESNGPVLFTAIQEQIGLKLEPGKGPVEVIVIDHIERPSGN
jgi:uncharacterized protein (TIGR03435 family)